MRQKIDKHNEDDANGLPIAEQPQSRIIVPCYNEAKRLDLDEFTKFMLENPGHTFVFVNDGSKDNTLEVLNRFKKTNPYQIEVLDLPQNSGKAEAVRQGLLYCINKNTPLIAYWDADLATPLSAIIDFERVLYKFDNITVVIGSRIALLGHEIDRDLKRRIVSKICAIGGRIAICLPVSDTQCGAKMFRNTPALKRAVTIPFRAGWLFDVELLSRLSRELRRREKARFYDYPLMEWNEIPGSKVSNVDIIKSGLIMLGLIGKLRYVMTVQCFRRFWWNKIKKKSHRKTT